MLVLTRKVNESIVIGGIVTITITEIKGNRVLLGINAPSGVKVLRSELIQTDGIQRDPQQLTSSFRILHAKVPTETASTVSFPPGSRKKTENASRNKRDNLEALNDAA